MFDSILWAEGEKEKFEKKINELLDKEYKELYYYFLGYMGYTCIDGESMNIADVVIKEKDSIEIKVQCMRDHIMRRDHILGFRSAFITREDIFKKYIVIVRIEKQDEKEVYYFVDMVEHSEYQFIHSKIITIEDFNHLCQLENERRRRIRQERERRERQERLREEQLEQERIKRRLLLEQQRRERSENESDSDSDSDSEDELIFGWLPPNKKSK